MVNDDEMEWNKMNLERHNNEDTIIIVLVPRALNEFIIIIELYSRCSPCDTRVTHVTQFGPTMAAEIMR